MSVRHDLPDTTLEVDVSRYDLLLAVLPLPLIIGAAVGFFSAFSMHVSVAMGSFPSTILLGYGLFYDNPTQP